ncbi:MAG: L,D-transpeptidase [Ferruginibacter sp.]
MKTNMKNTVIFLLFGMAFLNSCKQQKKVAVKKVVKQQPVRQQPKTVTYQIANAKQWLLTNGADSTKLQIALAVNRTDKAGFALMDSVIIPADMSGDIAYYLPFPLSVPYLADVNKIIFFSYPTQTFATYENGILIRTGPTNMGRKADPTPTGLFFANWKAEKTISTVNDEWELLWNFNIANKDGVGWHQYSLPGYPASHSCLRLQEKDARYLYDWADQWILDDKEAVEANGTSVIVFGSYNFDGPKPWLQLVTNPHALDITEAEIQAQATPFLNNILAEQKKRENVELSKQ